MGREGNGVVQGGGAGLFILSGVAQHSKQLTTRKKKLLNNLRGKGYCYLDTFSIYQGKSTFLLSFITFKIDEIVFRFLPLTELL